MTEFFVIGTAETHRQLVAIVEEIQEELLRHGERIWHVEGVSPRSASTSAQPNGLAWVLLDCGDLVIHLFNPPARAFYYLERLWADAPRIPLDPSTPLRVEP